MISSKQTGVNGDKHSTPVLNGSRHDVAASILPPSIPDQAPSLEIKSDANASFLRAARAGNLDKVLEFLKANTDINTSNANGLNALHLASKEGHVAVVKELLSRGALLEAATKKGNTALHIASLAGQEEVVAVLIQHGASVNVQSQNGFSPLYMAAQENHDGVVRLLLANGANQSLATEDGFTPLAVALQQGHDKVVAVLLENDTRGKVRLPALHIAAKKDDCKAAALLLQNDHNPDVTSKSGFTPLHIAAHYGNENIAALLIQRGADVNFPAKHHITPLHVAAKWGKSNMVNLLLEKNSNLESKTRDGLTPLHCAARSGHESVVDILLEKGAPISSKTKNGLAPLHMAAQGDHVEAARILLYHKAPVDEVTVDYLTALHVAAHCGHVRVAKLLLDRKADPNSRALNGFTPLHIACKKNRIKVVELLLKHGASIEATTESGLTPLHVASFMGCMNIVIYLLQHGAGSNVPTVRGETPLHLAARANQTDIVRILLRNGAQVDAKAREQQTPLHIASRLGNVDIVMLLLQHGAAVDAVTKDNYTALHIAAKEGQDEVASVLLENGASLTSATKKGFTPLHLAAKYGNMKVARLLLQRDAPIDAQGKNGVTPLHVAAHYDHQNVALLLLDKGASPHATAKNGYTPLHISAKKNQMDIATTLLEYGAKTNAESKAGFTPLHLSSQEGHTDMSTLLMEHQADPNFKSKNGLTPLHLCAQEDRVNVAAILVKNGAEVDVPTKSGYTPLHVASHFGQLNMVRFLLGHRAQVDAMTAQGYTPLHQAAQQGHALIINLLLENGASPNVTTAQGQTPLSIAQRLGYITVVETLKVVTETTVSTTVTTITEEKYKVQAPETMQETFMTDSEDEGGEDNMAGDQSYRYLTVDEMKSLGDDSLPMDVTSDERDGRRSSMTAASEEVQVSKENYAQFSGNYAPDNVDIARHPVNVGFLVSFMVDARGGAMRGCRHSGVRVIVPPRKAPCPMRITCRYLKRDRLTHPPPLMEGEALASRILELGPNQAKFLGPVIIEVPHFAALRGKEREIIILRSDNGETWREHTLEATEEAVQEVLNESFDGEDLSQLEDMNTNRITRILTTDFPQYFAVVSRVRQEVHAIGPEGGMVSSTVVPQVQAVFPQGALTKKIKVGLQAQPIPPELVVKLLGNRVAVSPIVTVEPRRRKFHKPITLTIPVPQAASRGMINQYSGDTPTLRLLCSITGGTTRAQWEDVTGSTPLTFVNDCVSFTTTVSARFWLMDCRNVTEASKMATDLYREAIHVPFMAKFVVFAKRHEAEEARLRLFCMTDDKEEKTLEQQEHFVEVAKSRDVEVLESKSQYIEFAGNFVPVTKSGDQLSLPFRAFRENRLPFTVRIKDPTAEPLGRIAFMREPKVGRGEPPQTPICNLNIVLPALITPETAPSEPDLLALQKKYGFLHDVGLIYATNKPEAIHKADLRLSDICNLLGHDWLPLARQLGIPETDIQIIQSEYPTSPSQQAMVMLRLWMQQSGNKATGNTLEKSLRKIGRDDIVNQCIFNVELVTDDLEKAIAKVHLDQSGFDMLRTELGPSRDATLRRNTSLDVSYDEQDLMKDSESVEELAEPIQGKDDVIVQPQSIKGEAKKNLVIEESQRDLYEEEERKYKGEEKAVLDTREVEKQPEGEKPLVPVIVEDAETETVVRQQAPKDKDKDEAAEEADHWAASRQSTVVEQIEIIATKYDQIPTTVHQTWEAEEDRFKQRFDGAIQAASTPARPATEIITTVDEDQEVVLSQSWSMPQEENVENDYDATLEEEFNAGLQNKSIEQHDFEVTEDKEHLTVSPSKTPPPTPTEVQISTGFEPKSKHEETEAALLAEAETLFGEDLSGAEQRNLEQEFAAAEMAEENADSSVSSQVCKPEATTRNLPETSQSQDVSLTPGTSPVSALPSRRTPTPTRIASPDSYPILTFQETLIPTCSASIVTPLGPSVVTVTSTAEDITNVEQIKRTLFRSTSEAQNVPVKSESKVRVTRLLSEGRVPTTVATTTVTGTELRSSVEEKIFQMLAQPTTFPEPEAISPGVQENIDSYATRKKFWEEISSGSSTTTRRETKSERSSVVVSDESFDGPVAKQRETKSERCSAVISEDFYEVGRYTVTKVSLNDSNLESTTSTVETVKTTEKTSKEEKEEVQIKEVISVEEEEQLVVSEQTVSEHKQSKVVEEQMQHEETEKRSLTEEDLIETMSSEIKESFERKSDDEIHEVKTFESHTSHAYQSETSMQADACHQLQTEEYRQEVDLQELSYTTSEESASLKIADITSKKEVVRDGTTILSEDYEHSKKEVYKDGERVFVEEYENKSEEKPVASDSQAFNEFSPDGVTDQETPSSVKDWTTEYQATYTVQALTEEEQPYSIMQLSSSSERLEEPSSLYTAAVMEEAEDAEDEKQSPVLEDEPSGNAILEHSVREDVISQEVGYAKSSAISEVAMFPEIILTEETKDHETYEKRTYKSSGVEAETTEHTIVSDKEDQQQTETKLEHVQKSEPIVAAAVEQLPQVEREDEIRDEINFSQTELISQTSRVEKDFIPVEAFEKVDDEIFSECKAEKSSFAINTGDEPSDVLQVEEIAIEAELTGGLVQSPEVSQTAQKVDGIENQAVIKERIVTQEMTGAKFDVTEDPSFTTEPVTSAENLEIQHSVSKDPVEKPQPADPVGERSSLEAAIPDLIPEADMSEQYIAAEFEPQDTPQDCELSTQEVRLNEEFYGAESSTPKFQQFREESLYETKVVYQIEPVISKEERIVSTVVEAQSKEKEEEIFDKLERMPKAQQEDEFLSKEALSGEKAFNVASNVESTTHVIQHFYSEEIHQIEGQGLGETKVASQTDTVISKEEPRASPITVTESEAKEIFEQCEEMSVKKEDVFDEVLESQRTYDVTRQVEENASVSTSAIITERKDSFEEENRALTSVQSEVHHTVKKTDTIETSVTDFDEKIHLQSFSADMVMFGKQQAAEGKFDISTGSIFPALATEITPTTQEDERINISKLEKESTQELEKQTYKVLVDQSEEEEKVKTNIPAISSEVIPTTEQPFYTEEVGHAQIDAELKFFDLPTKVTKTEQAEVEPVEKVMETVEKIQVDQKVQAVEMATNQKLDHEFTHPEADAKVIYQQSAGESKMDSKEVAIREETQEIDQEPELQVAEIHIKTEIIAESVTTEAVETKEVQFVLKDSSRIGVNLLSGDITTAEEIQKQISNLEPVVTKEECVESSNTETVTIQKTRHVLFDEESLRREETVQLISHTTETIVSTTEEVEIVAETRQLLIDDHEHNVEYSLGDVSRDDGKERVPESQSSIDLPEQDYDSIERASFSKRGSISSSVEVNVDWASEDHPDTGTLGSLAVSSESEDEHVRLSSMAFVNTGFLGVDHIDHPEVEEPQRSRSPFEVTRSSGAYEPHQEDASVASSIDENESSVIIHEPKSPLAMPKESLVESVWEVHDQTQMIAEETVRDISMDRHVMIEEEEPKSESEAEEDESEENLDEARKVAEEIIEEIKIEAPKLAELLSPLTEATTAATAGMSTCKAESNSRFTEETEAKVTKYIQEVTSQGTYDERQVELIEQVTERKIQQLKAKEEILSSFEITDEDLRSSFSGVEFSPTDSETVNIPPQSETKSPTVDMEQEEEVLLKTLAEVKESIEAAQEEIREAKRQAGKPLEEPSPSDFEIKPELLSLLQKHEEQQKHKPTTSQKARTLEIMHEEFRLEQQDNITAVERTLTPEIEKKMSEHVESVSKLEPQSEENVFTETETFKPSPMSPATESPLEPGRSAVVFDSKSPDGKSEKKRESVASPGSVTSASGDTTFYTARDCSLDTKTAFVSRPCSSDVETLYSGTVIGSSEYETALTSQVSSRSATSNEFYTAVSSVSSHDSVNSFGSDASGMHGASLDIPSEVSETLMVSPGDPNVAERDLTPTDIPAEFPYTAEVAAKPASQDMDDSFEMVPSAAEISQTMLLEEETTMEVAQGHLEGPQDGDFEIMGPMEPRMKRSIEMTFHPEPRTLYESRSTSDESPARDSDEPEVDQNEFFSYEDANPTLSISSLSDVTLATVVEQPPGEEAEEELLQTSEAGTCTSRSSSISHVEPQAVTISSMTVTSVVEGINQTVGTQISTSSQHSTVVTTTTAITNISVHEESLETEVDQAISRQEIEVETNDEVSVITSRLQSCADSVLNIDVSFSQPRPTSFEVGGSEDRPDSELDNITRLSSTEAEDLVPRPLTPEPDAARSTNLIASAVSVDQPVSPASVEELQVLDDEENSVQVEALTAERGPSPRPLSQTPVPDITVQHPSPTADRRFSYLTESEEMYIAHHSLGMQEGDEAAEDVDCQGVESLPEDRQQEEQIIGEPEDEPEIPLEEEVLSPPALVARRIDPSELPASTYAYEMSFERSTDPDDEEGEEYLPEPDLRDIESEKHWIAMQFDSVVADPVFEVEPRAPQPLADIEEGREDDESSNGAERRDLDRFKESLSSTPEFDVLSGRKYFTRSGEHDDMSVDSLQEFERLERDVLLEKLRRQSNGSGSSESLSSRRVNRSGDNISVNSLTDFERLEREMAEIARVEERARQQEAALLSEIDEGHESQVSESESCETMSDAGEGRRHGGDDDTDSDDYEQRMFEIDEIIRQAQSNVEKFNAAVPPPQVDDLVLPDTPTRALRVRQISAGSTGFSNTDTSVIEKTESIEASDLSDHSEKHRTSLMSQQVTTTRVIKSSGHYLSHATSLPSAPSSFADSLEVRQTRGLTESLDSLEVSVTRVGDEPESLDSLEVANINAHKSFSDSLDSRTKVPDDSLEVHVTRDPLVTSADSIEEDPSSRRVLGPETDSLQAMAGAESSSSSGQEDLPHDSNNLLLRSCDSLDANQSSSAATRATGYETDSIMSGSMTSGGSGAMISSTDTLDATENRAAMLSSTDTIIGTRAATCLEDLPASFMEGASAYGGDIEAHEEFFDQAGNRVTVMKERVEEPGYSYQIHRTVQMVPEVRHIKFEGDQAEERLREYMAQFDQGEDVHETRHEDEHGNVHVTRVVQRRIVVEGSPSTMSEAAMQEMLQQATDRMANADEEEVEVDDGQGKVTRIVRKRVVTFESSQGLSFTSPPITFPSSLTHSPHPFTHPVATSEQSSTTTTTTTTTSVLRDELTSSSSRLTGTPASLRRAIPRHAISIDDDDNVEIDAREHDWRFGFQYCQEEEDGGDEVSQDEIEQYTSGVETSHTEAAGK